MSLAGVQPVAFDARHQPTWSTSGAVMKKFFALGMALCAGASQAVVLYNNGPVVNSGGLSILNAPATTLGITSNALNTLADNFTVSGAGWTLDSVDFYAYQPQPPGPGVFTFSRVNWQIYAGSNIDTAAGFAGGTTAVTNAGQVGFRVTETALTDQQRTVFRINADIPNLTLPAGNYFLVWAFEGTGTSGPFVPPVLGSLGVGNAYESRFGGRFEPLQDLGSRQSYDLPFSLNGTLLPVPEPSSLTLLLAGGLILVRALRRR
jgi:hypothetical protein